MLTPLQITFRHMFPSENVEVKIREKVKHLYHLYENILGCKVLLDFHKYSYSGKVFQIEIMLSLPDEKIVVSREFRLGKIEENNYCAIQDAFEASRKQLKGYTRRQLHMRTPVLASELQQ